MARRTSIFGLFAALLALVLAFGAPAALAHHKDGHDKGGKPSSNEETVTEDNDDDNVANAPDPEGDADNKHPSGNDKHEEAGGSGNQGKAQSDPDDDGRGPDRSNGGVDQPGGTGGDDELDQDGNNGCGNDDDFEDDNEGWCGKNPKRGGGGSEVESSDEELCPDIEGMSIEDCDIKLPPLGGGRGVGVDVDGQPVAPEGVLGIRITAGPEVEAAAVAPAAVAPAVGAAAQAEGAVLPFTGSSDLVPFALIGLALIASGALGLRARRTIN